MILLRLYPILMLKIFAGNIFQHSIKTSANFMMIIISIKIYLSLVAKESLNRLNVSSLSIAIVTNEFKQYNSIEQLATTAAKVKKHCKKIAGSCFLINEPTRNIEHQIV